MTPDPRIQVDSVVQIDPSHDEIFGGCFLVVTEIKSFGVIGDVCVPGRGSAPYRADFENVRYIGRAGWAS